MPLECQFGRGALVTHPADKLNVDWPL